VYRSFLMRELFRLRKGHYRSMRLAVPSRLLVGDADPVIRPDILAGYEPYADEMGIEQVERCGHFVAEEHPELVIERARELFGLAGSSG
jgi:pimeloyl-ACP methyl ester carboxylesterase